jgi:dihydroorotate dehydrogenase electron transfer subunit
MALQTDGIVLVNQKIKSIYSLLEIACPSIADRTKPGQFVMLRTSPDDSPLLRRPFSVFKSYSTRHPEKRKRGRIRIVYKKVGKGTEKMAGFRKGETVNLIGPLGNGFTLPPFPSSTDILLVGGGIGIVSLYPIIEKTENTRALVFIGGKTEKDILCAEEFKQKHAEVFISTENGDLGFKGKVIDLLLSVLKKRKKSRPCYLYACGPMGMLRELGQRSDLEGFISQVSLEARMACGFGACWGCVVKTADSQNPYHRVCQEGPVFDLKEIAWE